MKTKPDLYTPSAFRTTRFAPFLACLALALTPAAWALTETFTTDGTWVLPANVSQVLVECRGAGGAGGSAKVISTGTTQARGGGGAGGSYASSVIDVSSFLDGAEFTVTVGAGGVANTDVVTHNEVSPSQTGGASVFSSPSAVELVKAVGGVGGGNALRTAVGHIAATGGVGSTDGSLGNELWAGGSGGTPAGATVNSGQSGGGGGGAGDAGPGGNGSVLSATAGGEPGVSGGGTGGVGRGAAGPPNTLPTAPGGGGGAVVATAASPLNVAAAGARGEVTISYTIDLGVDHYAVVADAPQVEPYQSAGVPFNVTITAQDISNATVTDSINTVIISSPQSGNLMEFDWNSDGTYGDNSGIVGSGVTIKARNKKAETVTLVATSGAITTAPIPSVTTDPAAFAQLQILVPGETAAPGTATGKTGTPGNRTYGTAFFVTVNAVDEFWNLVSTVTDTVGITSTAPVATLPADAALIDGTGSFAVTLKTVGSFTLTATDITDGNKFSDTTPNLTVQGINFVWQGDGSANLWDTTALNWTDPLLTPSAFASGNFAVFNDTSANPVVDIVGIVEPGSITVNAAQDFTFGSTSGGSIGGTTGLIKSGDGTLTLATSNSHSGTTTITGLGAVRAAATDALGFGTVTIGSNLAALGRLELSGGISLSNNITLHARTTASASLIGIQNISGNNTLSGPITISTGGNLYIIQSDADLLTLGTAGATAISYANLTNLREVKLQGAGNGVVAGNIIAGTSASQLTKDDAGTWTLSGTNTYAGSTVINAGTLALDATGTITNSASISIAAGATFDTTAKTSYAIPGTRPLTFGLDGTGTGSSGTIVAAELDVSAAVVSYNITGDLDDPVYVLAIYTTLVGTPNFDAPAGYTPVYDYQGNKIALVGGSDPFVTWAGPGVNFEDDANNDGIDNGLAWLLNANSPTSSVQRPVVTQIGGNLRMSFNMLPASARGGSQLFLEHSGNLGISDPWTSVLVLDATGGTAPVTFIVNGTAPLEVEATVSSTEAIGGKLFGRLRAER